MPEKEEDKRRSLTCWPRIEFGSALRDSIRRWGVGALGHWIGVIGFGYGYSFIRRLAVRKPLKFSAQLIYFQLYFRILCTRATPQWA